MRSQAKQNTKNTKIAPITLISGDTTLLVQEARDALIAKAKSAGFSSRQLITIEKAQNWQDALGASQNMGLFSERQIIDISNPAAKFDKATQGLLLNYTDNPNPDTCLVISCGKLTAAQKKAKWFKQLETVASIQIIWPLQKRELTQWVQQRLQRHKLRATTDTIELLIELTEGNLLAAKQAVEKLALLPPETKQQSLSTDQLIKVIHDSAQFNVFDLTQYALTGNTKRVIRIVQGLQAEGIEATLVLWALARETRELYTLLHQHQQGTPLNQLLAKQWASRRPLLQHALKRLSLETLSILLKQAHQADLTIKGAVEGDPWLILMNIAIGLAQARSINSETIL